MENRTYHHGNLREALVTAGVALARGGGPDAVVLRAAGREAGVSHNAAYRHFASHEDLLAAVAARCMDRLGRLMIQRTAEAAPAEPEPLAWARLEAVGRAYIDFALTEHGWFRTAFCGATPDPGRHPGVRPEPGTDPYLLLSARLDELVDTGALPPERRPGAEYGAWSAVHGLAHLLTDGPLHDLPPDEVRRAVDTVLATIARGL
ncbi:TetR/AcrR family transcriptional regulator [Streptomyces sp. CB01881]|uniref:TetR/AcrR family transcriptional regulator n=1 Tax=Streptomyces sp. CB01881 TaxID=2078691 RepID=UPI0019D54DDE|nr:TetR/AcrR family transcriptional regulator [Streptomyces sp. CB01881]